MMIVKVMYLRQYCELRVEISAVPCPARDPSEGTIFGSNDMISKLLHMRAFYPRKQRSRARKEAKMKKQSRALRSSVTLERVLVAFARGARLTSIEVDTSPRQLYLELY